MTMFLQDPMFLRGPMFLRDPIYHKATTQFLSKITVDIRILAYQSRQLRLERIWPVSTNIADFLFSYSSYKVKI